MAKWMRAQDTFVATLDGGDVLVTKGEMKPEGHAVVRHAPGLFTEADTGEDEKPPPKSEPAKAEAPPKAEVKARPQATAPEVKSGGKAPGRG